MAAANALLDTLRVPRKVIIDDQRAELQVQAFGCGFGGNHYISLMLEIIDGGCTPVGGLDTTDAVRVSEAPLLVDFVGLWFAGFAIEQNNAIGVAIGFEEVFKERLRLGGFGKYQGFVLSALFAQHLESFLQ